MSENKTKSKGLSIAMILLVIFLGFGFVIGLAQSSIFKDNDTTLKVQIKEFSFNGNSLVEYSGESENVEITKSYYLGPTENYAGTIIFNNRTEALNFLDEHYINGAEGYYDFYRQIYSGIEYPWTYEYSIEKPTFVEGSDIEVTTIADSAFQENTIIKKVIIPDTIERIGNHAFRDCSSLTEVILGNNLKSIGDSAFWGCAFTNITLPNSLERIEPYAFFRCANLVNLTIPANVNYMGIGICNACTNLKIVRITTLNQITPGYTEAYQPFSRCENLQVIYVPSQNLEFYKTTMPWALYQDKYQT